jgi:hypothetical protein
MHQYLIPLYNTIYQQVLGTISEGAALHQQPFHRLPIQIIWDHSILHTFRGSSTVIEITILQYIIYWEGVLDNTLYITLVSNILYMRRFNCTDSYIRRCGLSFSWTDIFWMLEVCYFSSLYFPTLYFQTCKRFNYNYKYFYLPCISVLLFRRHYTFK